MSNSLFVSALAVKNFRLIRKKSRGLDAGDLYPPATTWILAGHNIIEQQHIALEFLETSPRALIASLRWMLLLSPDKPA
jgi:hypothetical protein